MHNVMGAGQAVVPFPGPDCGWRPSLNAMNSAQPTSAPSSHADSHDAGRPPDGGDFVLGGSVALLCAEGALRLENGDLDGAEDFLREALHLDPDYAEALSNLGLALEQRGNLGDAETCLGRARDLAPAWLQAHLNLGLFLFRRRRLAEAEDVLQEAVRIAPHLPASWSNLGVVLVSRQRHREAEQCYRTAMGLDPAYAKARYNLAYLLLLRGDYEEGWHHMEAREWLLDCTPHLGCPPWRGEDLDGKSILIGVEGGHGDMIQFCRYVPLLKARGAKHVTLLCQPALKPLFASLAGVDQLVALGEPLPGQHWDFWTFPFSLPLACGTRLETIPAALPYLAPPPELIGYWNARLPGRGLRVGLVWKGNPRFENDAARSLPGLDVLAPLGAVAGASFVSLQKGAGEEEAAHPPAGLPLLDLGREIADFGDSAAIVAGLDLVISVDTAMAHLTGALGKPCWVLLADDLPDWRWLAGRDDCPWYPGTTRLFRQNGRGQWGPVIERVAAELARLAAQRG